ncbi:MAG: hypothetical protein C5B59_08060 [Bacteroidetes bacterium]|nr:MAG: hypothetical protein C5B59_08060 [Bacteroidota bacterium]
MITLQKIKAEIEALTYEVTTTAEMTSHKLGRIRTRVIFLEQCKKILEIGPGEDHLKSELARLEARQAKIMEGYTEWVTEEKFEKESHKLKAFEKMHDLPKLKEHVRAIRFLID